MERPMLIREPETLKEVRAAHKVIAAAWEVAFAEIVEEPALETIAALPEQDILAKRYANMKNSETRTLLVAVKEDVIGCASACWTVEDTKTFVPVGSAELRTLYVSPNRWGSGVGSALLEAIDDRIPDDRDRLMLETFTENDSGRAFYESQGFARVGSSTFSIASQEYPTVIYERPRD